MKGGCGALTDVNDSAPREAKAKRERAHEGFVVRAPIPADDNGDPFAGPRRLFVREGFAKHPHEGGSEGSPLGEPLNGFVFVNRGQRGLASNTVRAEERLAHVTPSTMLTLAAMHARDGDVGPNHTVWTEHHAGVGHAVAAKGAAFSQKSAELAQAAGKALSVHA